MEQDISFREIKLRDLPIFLYGLGRWRIWVHYSAVVLLQTLQAVVDNSQKMSLGCVALCCHNFGIRTSSVPPWNKPCLVLSLWHQHSTASPHTRSFINASRQGFNINIFTFFPPKVCFSDFFFHGKRLKCQLPTCGGSARSRTFQFYQLARRDLFQIIFDSILSCISIPAWNWPAHCHSLSLETTCFSPSASQVKELRGESLGHELGSEEKKRGLDFRNVDPTKEQFDFH